MTTPPEPPSSGDEREDAAAQSGQEAADAVAAASASIIAAMASVMPAVASGVLGMAAARRKIRVIISGALGGASKKLQGIFAAAAKKAGGKELPDAPGQIAKAILAGMTDAGNAFDAAMAAALGDKGTPYRDVPDDYRDIVTQATRSLTALGADVKDLEYQERIDRSHSRLKVAQKVLDAFANKGITGFTDSAGRKWELSAYAEMATRTAASRLALQTQLSKMAQDGYDLVIVDNPAMEAPCLKCRPWEGRVISLRAGKSGSSSITDAHGVRRTETIAGSLQDAVAAGLMHPNCRHSLVPWADGAGAVATAGGKPRGYVEDGKAISRELPIGTPAAYTAEQKLRAHERNVRKLQLRLHAAMTPDAKKTARMRLAVAHSQLEKHVRDTGVTRLPHREKAIRAR